MWFGNFNKRLFCLDSLTFGLGDQNLWGYFQKWFKTYIDQTNKSIPIVLKLNRVNSVRQYFVYLYILRIYSMYAFKCTFVKC